MSKNKKNGFIKNSQKKCNWLFDRKSFEKAVILPLGYSDTVNYEFYDEGVVVSVPVNKELHIANIGLNDNVLINKKDLAKSDKYIPVEWLEQMIEIEKARGLNSTMDTYFAERCIALWKYRIENGDPDWL